MARSTVSRQPGLQPVAREASLPSGPVMAHEADGFVQCPASRAMRGSVSDRAFPLIAVRSGTTGTTDRASHGADRLMGRD